MHWIAGAITAALVASMSGAKTARDAGGNAIAGAGPLDVGALLVAAQGAPRVICALAAQSVRNSGWNDWSDAPYTPLSPNGSDRIWDEGTQVPFASGDVDRLMEGLASPDACVREISVRLLGTQRTQPRIVSSLMERLTSVSVETREAASLGLGLLVSARSVDALVITLRDAAPHLRANAAWALGRIDDGRALAALVAHFGDEDATVRQAAVVAAGRIDSTSTVAALMRVLQHDESPAVRRVAAWALGQHRAQEAADVLTAALGRDTDPRVREMVAWAIGESGVRGASAALTNALRRDAEERVRETAAWALGEGGDRSAIDALGTAAADDASTRVRGTAAWAIGQLHANGTSAPAGLVKSLKDENSDTRLKAAWALGQVGDPGALDAVRDALKAEQNGQVQRALVRAVIKSGGRSEETLTQLLGSSDAAVREAAVRGLAGNNSFNPWPWPWPRPRPFP